MSTPTLTPRQLHEWMQHHPDGTLIDVRTPIEYRMAKISGSRLIPLHRLHPSLTAAGSPPTEEEIVLICQSGARTRMAAETMKKMGYTNVKMLEGGIGAWAAEGLPVEGNPHLKLYVLTILALIALALATTLFAPLWL